MPGRQITRKIKNKTASLLTFAKQEISFVVFKHNALHCGTQLTHYKTILLTRLISMQMMFSELENRYVETLMTPSKTKCSTKLSYLLCAGSTTFLLAQHTILPVTYAERK